MGSYSVVVGASTHVQYYQELKGEKVILGSSKNVDVHKKEPPHYVNGVVQNS